jgi:hypothetical protein
MRQYDRNITTTRKFGRFPGYEAPIYTYDASSPHMLIATRCQGGWSTLKAVRSFGVPHPSVLRVRVLTLAGSRVPRVPG